MNILIVDKSLAFALGLKHALLKSRLTDNDGMISIYSEYDFNIDKVNTIDLLFIDTNSLNQINAIEFIKHLRFHNTDFKFLVSSSNISSLDITKFIEIQPNGLFTKGISKDDFNNYLKKVLEIGFYIDFKAVCNQLEIESDFSLQTQQSHQNMNSLDSSAEHKTDRSFDKNEFVYTTEKQLSN